MLALKAQPSVGTVNESLEELLSTPEKAMVPLLRGGPGRITAAGGRPTSM